MRTNEVILLDLKERIKDARAGKDRDLSIDDVYMETLPAMLKELPVEDRIVGLTILLGGRDSNYILDQTPDDALVWISQMKNKSDYSQFNYVRKYYDATFKLLQESIDEK